MAEDEMVTWHHQLDGHEFEQTQEDSGRQRSVGRQRVRHNLANEPQQPPLGESRVIWHNDILNAHKSCPTQLLKANAVSFVKHNCSPPSIGSDTLCQSPAQTQHLQGIGALPDPPCASDEYMTTSEHLADHLHQVTHVDGDVFHMFHAQTLSQVSFQELLLSHGPNKRMRLCLLP